MDTSLNLATSAAMSPVIGLGMWHLSAVLGGAPARLPTWANMVCENRGEDKTAANRMVRDKRFDLIAFDFSPSTSSVLSWSICRLSYSKPMPNRISDPQVLLLDADDTLWENNVYFEQAIADFIERLNHRHMSPQQVRQFLNEVERETILERGYGSHRLAHS